MRPQKSRHTDAGMLVTPAQMRAARALIGWSREELARRAELSPMTVKAFEAQGVDAKTSTVLKMVKALSSAGVEFTSSGDAYGSGVRFRRPEK